MEFEKHQLIILKNELDLREDPVKGHFDFDHLKKIHSRLFSGTGLKFENHFRPGKFRSPLPPDYYHHKTKYLDNGENSEAFYSDMQATSFDDAEKALRNFKISLSTIKKSQDTFATKVAELYAKLDYFHPFSEGNSRTLRIFTEQLANENGFSLNWQKTNLNEMTRDDFYIARDYAVRDLAATKLAPNSEALYRLKINQASFADNITLANIIENNIEKITSEKEHVLDTNVKTRSLSQYRKEKQIERPAADQTDNDRSFDL